MPGGDADLIGHATTESYFVKFHVIVSGLSTGAS
ncbi:MAG: hypothetical protein QOK29_2284 [Rhodospirillaceae bacterium]|jgi:hypothetical protein|nr:hypothetical protein [Rhodospirillaceae bacterium]